jgi:hypothetical protein
MLPKSTASPQSALSASFSRDAVLPEFVQLLFRLSKVTLLWGDFIVQIVCGDDLS